MLATLRMIKNLRDREHFLRTRYQKDHPHFLAYLALDAIVTVLLVTSIYSALVGNGIFAHESHALVDLGAAPISLNEVKKQGLDHHVQFYWVGPMGSGKYSTEVSDQERITLHYLLASANVSNVTQAKEHLLSVVSYPSLRSYDDSVQGPLYQSSDIHATNDRGDLVTYNKDNLDEIAVTLVDTSAVVVLKYPRNQTIDQLLRDSERVTPID